VVFSLAELDTGITDSAVIIADTMDGAPLGDKFGSVPASSAARKAPGSLVTNA